MKEQEKIQSVINQHGDTLIQMSLADAKFILKVVLEKEVNDSLLNTYTTIDSLTKNKVILLTEKVEVLEIEKQNLKDIVVNLNSIITNKETESQILNDVIKKQKTEIRKQKIIKIVALVGDVVLPVTVFLAVMFAK